MKPALAANLARLRIGHGLSQEEVAEAAGISRVAYASLEGGKAQPRSETLYALSRVLEVPVEQLLVEPVVLDRVRFRSTRRLKLREEIIVRTARWLDDFSELEVLLGDVKPLNLPDLARVAGQRIDPREAARAVRGALRVADDAPIRNIGGLLEERAGIKLRLVSYASEDFFGLSVRDPQRGAAIAINAWSRISVERWIFSCAHELAHLVLHLDEYHVDQKDEEEATEKEADIFAAHFLMPDDLFRHEWAKSRGLDLLDRVFQVKRVFRVSYRTVLMRLSEHGERDIWGRFAAMAKRRFGKAPAKTEELKPTAAHAFASVLTAEEPQHLLPCDLVETRLSLLVREALERELISLGRAAEILDCSMHQLRELMAAWVA